MKKLLLFSLLLVAIPAVSMQPAYVNVPTTHTPGLYIHPIANRFQGNDAPTSPAVRHLIHDDKPEIIDSPALPNHLSIDRVKANETDSNGRNLIWWVALMGKKNIYNELVKMGANPDVKSSSGMLAGFSASELIKMSPEEITAIINSGAKTKL